MKTPIRFKIFDTKEHCYLQRRIINADVSFSNKEMADEYRHNYLQKGNYPDSPYTVLEIHQFINGKFCKVII